MAEDYPELDQIQRMSAPLSMSGSPPSAAKKPSPRFNHSVAQIDQWEKAALGRRRGQRKSALRQDGIRNCAPRQISSISDPDDLGRSRSPLTGDARLAIPPSSDRSSSAPAKPGSPGSRPVGRVSAPRPRPARIDAVNLGRRSRNSRPTESPAPFGAAHHTRSAKLRAAGPSSAFPRPESPARLQTSACALLLVEWVRRRFSEDPHNSGRPRRVYRASLSFHTRRIPPAAVGQRAFFAALPSAGRFSADCLIPFAAPASGEIDAARRAGK